MDPGFSLPDPTFEPISQLTLGTVQMGMDYGLAPPTQRPNDARAKAIFDHAWELGITCFDTARAYGDAEARIGHWSAETGHARLVVTKFPPVEDAAALEANLAESARALGCRFLDAVLAHQVGDLQNPDNANALRRAREEERIGAFGASAYSPEEAETALGVGGLTALQVPLNAFDQRMAESGAIGRAGAALEGPEEVAEQSIAVAVRMSRPILLPEQGQGHALALQFRRDGGPVRLAGIAWWTTHPAEQRPLQDRVVLKVRR